MGIWVILTLEKWREGLMTWKSLPYGRQQALLHPNYDGSIFLSTRDRIHLLRYRWINVNYIEIAGGSLHRFSFTGSGTPVHVSGVFQLITSFGLFLEKKKTKLLLSLMLIILWDRYFCLRKRYTIIASLNWDIFWIV